MFIEMFEPHFIECENCKKIFIFNRLHKSSNRRMHSSKLCNVCRDERDYNNELKTRFGREDIEIKCFVCGFENEKLEYYNGHHIISKKIDLNGEKVVLCTRCHIAVHNLRQDQTKPLTKEQIKKLLYLVNKCTTRMDYYPYIY